MRRVMVVLAVLVLAGIAWFLFAPEPDATDGPRGGSVETAKPESVRAPVPRVRTPEEVREEEVSAFLAQWPEIGQDREQDPKLGAIRGRVFKAKEMPATEGVVETAHRGTVTARAKLGKTGEFLVKNVPVNEALSVTARSPVFAPGGVDRILVGAGETFDVGTLYLGAATDPATTNRIEVRITDGEGRPVAGARVTATSTLYGALVALGPFEKQPGGTVIRQATDGAGVAVFEKLPPASYDVFAESDGLAFDVEQRYLVQRDTKATIEMRLAVAKTIEGIVTDEAGQPVAKAHLGAFRMNNFTMNPAVYSGDDGKFVIGGLADGAHMIFCFKEGAGEKDVQNVAAGAKDLTIVLEHGADVAIRVTDKATGAPVKSFGVRPFRNQPFAYLFSPLIEVTTEDGVWRHNLPSMSHGLEISAKGYAQKTLASFAAGQADPIPVELDASRVVHGKVVSSGDRAAVRGAKVFVKKGGFPPSPVKDMQTVSDENGVFVMDGLPSTPISIWVSHVDHTDATFTVDGKPRGEGGALPPVEEFALGRGGRITGHAYGQDHAPLAGESVVISKGAMDILSLRNAVVGADGAFEFRNVPPATYRVSLGGGFGGEAKNGVAVTEGGVVTVDFGMATGGQRLAGKLVKDDQTPVARAAIALDDGSGSNRQTETDVEGRFAFDNVPPGKVSLRSWGRTKVVDVVVPADAPPPEVVLTVMSGSVEGRFVDAETGQPIPGVFADCEQTADATGKAPEQAIRSRRGFLMAGADGVFRFGALDEGTYRIRGQRDQYGLEMLDGIVVGPGERKSGVEIRMSASAGVLAGTARTAGKEPIEGASVQIRDGAGRLVFSISQANTSSDGSYSQAGLKPGEYDVTLEKEGFAPATKRVAIEAKKEARADFTLLQGGRIEVSARLADGSAAPRVTASLLDASGRLVEKGLTFANIFSAGQPRTDANGQITIRGVAPGSYTVRLRQDDGTEATAAVEVTESASTAVEIRFRGQ